MDDASAGEITNTTVLSLSKALREKDIVIDGSNSFYPDTIANAKALGEKSIFYLDVGFGGGPSDVLRGASLMVGGDRTAFGRVEDVFRVLAGSGTYGYVGGSGAGHGTKIVHNVMSYGLWALSAEAVQFLQEIKRISGDDFDMQEALRLLAAAPP